MCNAPALLPVLLPQSNEWQIHSTVWKFKKVPVTPSCPHTCTHTHRLMLIDCWLWNSDAVIHPFASPHLSVQSLISPRHTAAVPLSSSIHIISFSYSLLVLPFSPLPSHSHFLNFFLYFSKYLKKKKNHRSLIIINKSTGLTVDQLTSWVHILQVHCDHFKLLHLTWCFRCL